MGVRHFLNQYKFLASPLFKIISFIVFILIFYKVIIDILLFFDIEGNTVYMYMGWFIFLYLLFIILPFNYGLIEPEYEIPDNTNGNSNSGGISGWLSSLIYGTKNKSGPATNPGLVVNPLLGPTNRGAPSSS